MTNHEKALKTYQELQKRKADKVRKEKKLNADIYYFNQDTFFKCLSRRHDLAAYR
jgi:hypothetical protein